MQIENRFPRWLNLVTLAVAGVSAVLGFVALVGWHTYNLALIQVLPTFVSMQYNTALGFFLCGIGLLSMVLGWPRLAIVGGGIVATVGLLTLLEYVFGVDFGIDQILPEHYLTVKTSHPGRMAPTTALCFALSGAALLVGSMLTHLRHRPLILGLLGSVITALGVGTLFTWRVRVWPELPLLTREQSFLPNVVLVVGLVMASLLVLTVYFAQTASLRAHEVGSANQKLQSEIAERKRAESELEREARVSRGQMQALARALIALTTRPSLDTFLDHVIAAIVQQLRVDMVALWLYDKVQDRLSLHLAYEGEHPMSQASAHQPARLYLQPASDFPFWRELAQTGRPIIVDDVEGDPRVVYRESLMTQGVQTLLFVPLWLADEALGYLDLRFTERRRYYPAEVELAQALSQQVTLAVQLTRLAEQGRQFAVLEERNRIARDMHDTLAQSFTGIVLQLEVAEDALTDDPGKVKTHLTQACNLAREGLAEARRSVKALRPQVLEGVDLPTDLERLARQLTTGMKVQVDFHVHGTPRALSPEVATNLLHIGREALTNACKHAQAQVIGIDLTFESRQVQLRVQDNGRGWDYQWPFAGDGFGLTSMQERAKHMGGRLTLTSRPGQGTEVRVVAPAFSLDSL